MHNFKKKYHKYIILLFIYTYTETSLIPIIEYNNGALPSLSLLPSLKGLSYGAIGAVTMVTAGAWHSLSDTKKNAFQFKYIGETVKKNKRSFSLLGFLGFGYGLATHVYRQSIMQFFTIQSLSQNISATLEGLSSRVKFLLGVGLITTVCATIGAKKSFKKQSIEEITETDIIEIHRKPIPRIILDVSNNAEIDKEIKSNTLTELDSNIRRFIQKKLNLSKKDIKKLFFYTQTEYNYYSFDAKAYYDINLIKIAKHLHNMIVDGLKDSYHIQRISYKKYLTATISPELAKKIFLHVMSHEIGHIKRRSFLEQINRNDTQQQIYEEKQADANTLDEHCAAAYICYSLYNFILCYDYLSEMEDEFLLTLIPNKEIREQSYLDQVLYVVTHTSSLLENKVNSLYKYTRIHPTALERALFFKKRLEKIKLNRDLKDINPEECLTLKVPISIDSITSYQTIYLCDRGILEHYPF